MTQATKRELDVEAKLAAFIGQQSQVSWARTRLSRRAVVAGWELVKDGEVGKKLEKRLLDKCALMRIEKTRR